MSCGPAQVKAPGDVVVREHYTVANPDPSLRACADRPVGGADYTDPAAVARLFSDFAAYGDDCKSKHDATWKSIDSERAIADKLNGAKP